MSIKKELYGLTKDGQEIFAYIMCNSNGMEAKVINYGAILTHLFVPDKQGEKRDVVLGYSDLESFAYNKPGFG